MKYDLYDFDGTIYDGDSGVDLVKFAIKKNPKFLLKFPKILWATIKFFLKIGTKEQAKNVIFSFLKDVEDVDAFVEEFWKKHEHKMKKFWIEKKDHSKDIIISASGYFWLKPIADKYKVKDLIATNIDPKTGEVIGANCHGKQKVKLFYNNYPKDIVNTMYTDSVNDLPLIEEAKKGYLVKKDKVMPYYDYKPNPLVRFWRWGWGVYHKNEELWNYLIVGALTTVVSLVTYFICTNTFCNPERAIELQVANIVSWIVAVAFAYITNRIFVFKSKSKQIFKEITSFVGSRILSLLMDMGAMAIMVTLLGWNDGIGKIITQVIVTIANYIFSKLFVFKKKD